MRSLTRGEAQRLVLDANYAKEYAQELVDSINGDANLVVDMLAMLMGPHGLGQKTGWGRLQVIGLITSSFKRINDMDGPLESGKFVAAPGKVMNLDTGDVYCSGETFMWRGEEWSVDDLLDR